MSALTAPEPMASPLPFQATDCKPSAEFGHLGRTGQWFGKVLYRGFMEEFPDLASEVSEVSNG